MGQFFRDEKDNRRAMNGRMALMTGGFLLIFSAVTSTLMYGLNLIIIAVEANKGTEEYVELLASANLRSSLIAALAVLFFVLTAFEIFVGVFCTKYSNHIEKSKTTIKLIIILFAVEIVVQVILLVTQMMNLSMLFSAIVIPGYLLFGATRFTKLLAAYPDATYAVMTRKIQEEQRSAQARAQKNLRQRAMMKAPKNQVEFTDEIPEEAMHSTQGGMSQETADTGTAQNEAQGDADTGTAQDEAQGTADTETAQDEAQETADTRTAQSDAQVEADTGTAQDDVQVEADTGTAQDDARGKADT